jgi:uncharacterized protein (DUF1697 family)
MALVVFLRGVNVGGNKTFRPTLLAKELDRLHVTNIGAAGTFIIRKPIGKLELYSELAGRLPFKTEIVICRSREILEMISENPYAHHSMQPGTVRFVSILSARPRLEPSMPISFPSGSRWLVRILARKDRFVFGMFRRHMQTIRYLGMADRLFGVPVTTRNWNTMQAIVKALRSDKT